MKSKLSAAIVAAYFFALAGGGLRASFTYDDLGNAYRAWVVPAADWVKGCLLFFQPPPRPLGNLFYAVMFEITGFDLLPSRVVCYALLGANLLLLYSLTRRLAGSPAAGAVAALLYAFHGGFSPLYYNNGTLYDIFCAFFYLAALECYTRIRHTGAQPSLAQSALIVLLFLASLDSKEMAVTFPLMILVYEALYHGSKAWLLTNAPLWGAGTAALAYGYGMTRGAESLASLPGYKPVISAGAYLASAQAYLNELVYSGGWFDNTRAAALLLALPAVAALLRDRALAFGWILLAAGALPVAFIPPRGMYSMYLPLAGLALYAGALAGKAMRPVVDPRLRLALFTAAAGALGGVHIALDAADPSRFREEYAIIRDVREQITRLHPSFPKGSRILFLKDPFGRDWDTVTLLRLTYRDNDLIVDRMDMPNHPIEAARHDFVFTWEDGRLREIPRISVESRKP